MQKHSSLRILPNEATLFGDSSPLLAPLEGFDSDASSGPRALRTLARIIEDGLCHRCGSCVGICPTQVLAVDDNEYPRVKNLSACTDCDLCVKVCPGDEFNWEEQYKTNFGSVPALDDTHGIFNGSFLAHSTDPDVRKRSTSGGVVTELLLSELELGNIQGAVVIGSDDDTLWKGKAIVARNREEILSSMKSKYAICATNSVLGELRGLEGKYAVVGLPCQVHGVKKAIELDTRLKQKVAFTVGLFCHAAIDHEAFRVIWGVLGDRTKGAKGFVSRVGKHPGAPHLIQADGSLYPIYFGDRTGFRPSSMEVINILYRLYTPQRCTTCFDALSEFADIAVGDPWLPPPEKEIDFQQGWSFILTRTQIGAEIYARTLENKHLASKTITPTEARISNDIMSHEKKWRAFRVIETHRRQGKAIPRYHANTERFPAHDGIEFVKTELHMLSHLFCFLPTYRSGVLKFMLTKGYWLFWLNNKRRRVRIWIRDNLYRLRCTFLGRK